MNKNPQTDSAPNKERPRMKYRQLGQSLVEFALVLPVLLLLAYGTIEFGRLIFFYTAVTTASREAARYGAAVGNNGGGVPYYKDCVGIMEAGLRAGSFAGLDASNISIQYDNGPGSTTFASCSSTVSVSLGDRIVVQTLANYQPIVPLVNIPPFPIQSSSARTIIKGVDIEGTPPNTPTPAPPTPTRTVTPTPEFTSTPTGTLPPEPTGTLPPTSTEIIPTETPQPCSLLDASQLLINDHTIELILYNYDTTTVSISSLAVNWGNSGSLHKIKLGGSQIWHGHDNPPQAHITSFTGDTSLPTGAKTLRFEFTSQINYADEIHVTVTFDNGCTISRYN